MNKDELKAKYLKYYADLPVQKYAAMYVGRDEDTILNWRKEDSAFSDQIQELRAAWVAKKVSKAKVEFALERLEKDVFKETKEIEVKNWAEHVIDLGGWGDAGEDQTNTAKPPKEVS